MKRQLSFSKQVLRVSDLPYNQQPVCIYEIFDEVQGFRKWGPYIYWLKFKEIKNMKVIVAAGEKFSKAEVLFSTELKTLVPGYKIKIEASDKAWIAVVPEGQINILEMEYIEIKEAEAHGGGLSEEDHHLLKVLQKWILIGGFSFVAFIMMIMCLARRFQRWREL